MLPNSSIRRLMATALFLTTASMAAAAVVENDATGAEVHRLSPAEIEAAMKDGPPQGSGDSLDGPGIADRGIHGEVGAYIGTGGTRGAYGAAAVPLGDNASAAFFFQSDRTNLRRGW